MNEVLQWLTIGAGMLVLYGSGLASRAVIYRGVANLLSAMRRVLAALSGGDLAGQSDVAAGPTRQDNPVVRDEGEQDEAEPQVLRLDQARRP